VTTRHRDQAHPVDRLREQLRGHRSREPREERALRRTLALLDWLDAPMDEHADPTHVTGSAIVRDSDGRILLHRHKRLGIWLQPGGHVDPGESCEEAALRETWEETGLRGELADADPLHVDVHEGPRGHVHLDVRWLVEVQAGATPAPPEGESQDVAWFSPSAAIDVTDLAAANAIRAALD
jgi:8-oxo-dGTP pyrophosphatase MutT (NUDIX family)